MTEELFDWFQYEVDIAIAEPEEDKVKGGLCGGALQVKELSLALLEEVELGGGHFVLRVDVTPEDFWLRVRASTRAPAPPTTPPAAGSIATVAACTAQDK